MMAFRNINGLHFPRNVSHSCRGWPLISKQAKTARVLVASAAASAGSRPLHHIAPEGLSSAWVLPNVPQQHGPLRAALSLLQHQIDQLMFGSTADRVTGSLAAAALCIVVHRAWAKEAASEESLEQQIDKVPYGRETTAVVNQNRTHRFISRATEQAAQLLLSAANRNNTLPDIQWDIFPAAIRQHLLQLFQHKGWVNLLGFPVCKKQLPYERPMGLGHYHSFISSNPYYCADWDEDYWIDQITPTPAQHPWIHVLQLQQALTEDELLSMSARIPAFQAVLEAAVAASILPEQLLLQAKAAAIQASLSTSELFICHWMQQAGSAVVSSASGFLTKTLKKPFWRQGVDGGKKGITLNLQGNSADSTTSTDAAAQTLERGGGSGGRCYGAITAVGGGDEGGRHGQSVSVCPYGDAQQQTDLSGGAEGLPDAADQHLDLLLAGAGVRQAVAAQQADVAAGQQYGRQPDLWAAATALQLPTAAAKGMESI